MKILSSFCAALLLPLAVTPAALGQDQPPEFLQVTTVSVRPSAISEYEDYVKKIQAGAAKIGAAPAVVNGYQMRLGGPGTTYVFVAPFEKWGELDTWMSIPQILTKAYGEVEGPRILKAGRAAVESFGNEVLRLLPNLSTRPRRFVPPPGFVQLFRTTVKPGHGSDWELFLAKLKGAQEKEASGPTAIRRVMALGPAGTYVTVAPFDKWAERETWPSVGVVELLRKTYGESEARKIDELRLGSIQSSELYVLAHRPDLSRAAPAAPAK